MRRCCEETMKVLRANKDALTTIIAVLVHDPIVKWAVSSKRQRTGISVEEADNGLAAPNRNLDAERALLGVTQKLDGYEEGEILSVEGQVQQLLHDAQDEEKSIQDVSRLGRLGVGFLVVKWNIHDFSCTRIKFTPRNLFRHIDFCLSKFLTFSSKKHDPLTKPCIFSSADYNGRQDGSQQSLHFFRWECARGNEQRWQGGYCAAAAKKQETFSPQVLKAVKRC